jgi:hypothetical protein
VRVVEGDVGGVVQGVCHGGVGTCLVMGGRGKAEEQGEERLRGKGGAGGDGGGGKGGWGGDRESVAKARHTSAYGRSGCRGIGVDVNGCYLSVRVLPLSGMLSDQHQKSTQGIVA